MESINAVVQWASKALGTIGSNYSDFDAIVNSANYLAVATGGLKIVMDLHQKAFLANLSELYAKIRENNSAESGEAREDMQKLFNKNIKERERQTKLLLLIVEKQNLEDKIEYFANLIYMLNTDRITVKQYELYMQILDDLYYSDITELINYTKHSLEEEKDLEMIIGQGKPVSGTLRLYDLNSLKRAGKTGLLDEYASVGLDQGGRIEGYKVTSITFHFVSAILGDMSIHENYVEKNK